MPGDLILTALELKDEQTTLIQSPIVGSIALHGEAGTGKTTAGMQRLLHLVQNGVPGESILVLAPQRSLALPYFQVINHPDFPPGGHPSLLTFNGLAQRMLTLFWPIIAAAGGFKQPNKPPKFLTLETAQYYMGKIVEPLLEQGYFENLTIDPHRLYSQIIDNLNKSAVVGFAPQSIAEKLTSAWVGRANQQIIYQQAQECALRFRDFCLSNNMLDFSLQLDIFTAHLWPSVICRQYLQRVYRHLIYDNVEEDVPIAHDVVREWLPAFESALLIKDDEAGYRSFLGADPQSADRLVNLTTGSLRFSHQLVRSDPLARLKADLINSILTHRVTRDPDSQAQTGYSIHPFRFYPQCLQWVAEETEQLINQHSVAPGDIAILTPFLSDSLRFSMTAILESLGVPYTTYRPSRSLKEEPAVKTILALAKIAHPLWDTPPSPQDVRAALAFSIKGCDFVRADLLAQTLFRRSNIPIWLSPFDQLKIEMQGRITYLVGERYTRLRDWLEANSGLGNTELDHWISRLFGELLSQPGFGFHEDPEAAARVSQLLESCRKFRRIYAPPKEVEASGPAKEFIQVLESGLLAAQSLTSFSQQSRENAVFLSPAFSFLMSNRPVAYQFWLDIGSQGWWSRLDQPLTQPYVLSRNWEPGMQWTDQQEYETNQHNLARVAAGILNRCRNHVYMTTISLNEQGMEERGQLLLSMQNVLRAKMPLAGGTGV